MGGRIIDIDDISEMVTRERENARDFHVADLRVPAESPYPVENPDVAQRLRLDTDSVV